MMKDHTGFLTEAMEQACEAVREDIKRRAEEELRQTTERMKEDERRQLVEKAIEEKVHITRELYNRYLAVGFTEDQAWELVKIHAQMSPLYGYNGCSVA